jgi:hypothetical protein
VLTPDFPRTLRITGWWLIVMGGLNIPVQLFVHRDALAAWVNTGLLALGWWMVEKSRDK